MLFHALYDEGSTEYFQQAVLRLEGALDRDAFRKGWELVVRRHDALRTAFVVKGVPEPLQVVLRERPLDMEFYDLGDMTEADARAEIARFRAEDKARGFDTTTDRLLRLALFRLSDTNHVMVMSFHHIIMDGWCQGILAEEFVSAYRAFAAGNEPALRAAPQYRDFIRWIDRQDKEEALAYWKERLAGFERATHFPTHGAEAANETSKAEQPQGGLTFRLTRQETSMLTRAAVEAGVTIGTAMQTLWGMLLARLNGTDDAVFLATVSGRPADLDNAGRIVGLFINAVPVRVQLKGRTFAEVLTEVHRENGASGPYQFAPLSEIQAGTAVKRDLSNTLLVFENYPFAAAKDEAPFGIIQEEVDEKTNYDLTVQVYPGEELGFGLAWDRAAVDDTMVDHVEGWLKDAIEALAANPAAAADTLFSGVEPVADLTDARPRLDVRLAATFTAEPILPTLEWWLKRAEYSPDITVAGYNQIFQELLDPASGLARSEGTALLLVRFEDWIRDLRGEAEAGIVAHLESTFAEYLRAIDGFSGKATLVQLLLPTEFDAYTTAVAGALRSLQERFIVEAESRPDLHLFDCRDLPELYAVRTPFDHVADEAGHIPYTPEMNAAIGTAAARTILSRTQHPFKVIAVDCDNTLWDGIVGEDGPEGCTVFGGYRDLQEFLIEKYNEGFLIVLNSKNNENDVWEVFDTNPDMLLKREHVVAHRINWRPKSGNLKEMADELNLNVNSFLFLDDSGVECAEVRENAPDVLTLRVPRLDRHEEIPRLARHIWALDKWTVTDEDRKRSEMYVAERDRKQEEESAGSMEEFLSGLGLKISMAPVADHQVPRVSQLTQRTNQFNISTIRRDESEIRQLMADDSHVCWAVTVEDRFGAYGLVGVVICRADGNELLVDTLLLSCRVLGRGVEEAILSGMRYWSKERGLTTVRAPFFPTKKNAPALNFLQSWEGDRIEGTEGQITFVRTVESLPDGIPFGEYDYRTEPMPAADEPSQTTKKPVTGPIDAGAAVSDGSANGVGSTNSSIAAALESGTNGTVAGDVSAKAEAEGTPFVPGWTVNVDDIAGLPHAFHYLPVVYNTGRSLLNLPDDRSGDQGSARAEYVEPVTQDERALTEVFSSVLRLDSVGMNDDFFELGGHSLTAVELLSNIHRTFDTEISLRSIFERPTPAELLKVIRSGEAGGYRPIERLPKLAHYHVSHAQRRLWALDQIQTEGSGYVIGGANVLEGPLDIEALEGAFGAVIRRHESLRTAIEVIHGEPSQIVNDAVPFALERIDLRGMNFSDEELEAEAKRIVHLRERDRFDLSAPPLLRATLITLGDERHVLAFYMHHIIGDGWSYPLFVRELAGFYDALRRGESDPDGIFEPLRIHYRDYAAYQQEELRSNRARDDEQFWLESLTPLPAPLELPTDYGYPAQPTYEGDSFELCISDDTVRGLSDLCRAERGTLFMGAFAAVRALLWSYSRQTDMTLGVPVAGRDHPELADQIGFYVNTLPIRGTVEPAAPFRNQLRQVREQVIEAFAHQSSPFDLIVNKLEGVGRNTGRSPVFDVMVAMQNNRDVNAELDGLTFSQFGPEAGAGKLDLVFNFKEVKEGLRCSIEYRTDLFSRERIEGIGRDLERMLTSVATDPDGSIEDLLSPMERVAEEAAQVAKHSAPTGTIPERFEVIAGSLPDAVALLAGDRKVTYGDLRVDASRVAAALHARGIGSGHVVAVMLPRSTELITSMLGVMKSGATYLPIDPEYPESRIAMILEDSRARLIIGDEASEAESSGQEGVESVTVADLLSDAEGQIEMPRGTTDDAAYVIYTSGSTGTPKGVSVGHTSFLNMIAGQIETFGVTEEDCVLQFASPSFDASMSETFMTLLCGATLVLPRREELLDLDAFTLLMERAGVSVATIPPVYLRSLGGHPLPTLRVLITAGEEAPVDEVISYARAGKHVFNAYGPTECSVCATIHRIDPEREYRERIPIGSAVPGVGAFVADPQLRPVPNGAEGELILFGHGLAHGYLHNAELTAERFPIAARLSGIRCYRTGDRVRVNASGEFEFLGRVDNQVKIRGHRVEPDEARHALLTLPGVEDGAVIAVGSAGNKELVAFACGDESLHPGQIKSMLGRMLPHYLVPSDVQILEALPVTTNGKVDRKQLERRYRDALSGSGSEGAASGNGAGPRNEREAMLAKAFSEVLNRPVENIHDSFFTLGGDSIKAIQVRGALRRYGFEVRSGDIYEGQTVAEIAPRLQAIDGEIEEESTAGGPIEPTPIISWFSERLPGERAERFMLPLVLDITGPVDEGVLRAALDDIAKRHATLRMVAERSDGRISMHVRPFEASGPEGGGGVSIPLEIIDLSDADDIHAAMEERFRTAVRELRFDGAAPLVRSILCRANNRQELILVMHHLVNDAVSLSILMHDLNEAYEARLKGNEPAFGVRSTSYGTWSAGQKAFAESPSEEAREFWRDVVRRTRSCPEPFGSVGNGGVDGRYAETDERELRIDGESAGRIMRARRRGIDVHHALLGALRATFARMTGNERLAVLMESHGRGGEGSFDLTQTVGWFTAVYPMVLEPRPTPYEEIKVIRAELNELTGRESEYGSLRYLADDSALRSDMNVDPQISFNYLGNIGAETTRGEHRRLRYAGRVLGERFGLNPFEINAGIVGDEVRLSYRFQEGLFDGIDASFEQIFREEVDRFAASLDAAGGEVRLLCMPSAGGDANTFQEMVRSLPDSFETITPILPGHGDRIDEEPLDRLPEMIAELMTAVRAHADRPYIIFGHSLGALLAFEVSREIHRSEPELRRPDLLVCSGAPAPKHLKYGEMMSELPDYEFIRAYHQESVRKGEVPPSGAELERMIKATRSDYIAVEHYAYMKDEPLPFPMLVLRGTEEKIIVDMVHDWDEEAQGNAVFREIRGGHEYPFSNAPETVAVIVEEYQSMREYA